MDCTPITGQMRLGDSGSKQKCPGIDKPSVINALDVFHGVKTGKNIIIVGGGIVGCEAALILGKKGAKITLTSRQSEIARGLSVEMKRAFRRIITELDVNMVTGVRLEEVTDKGILVSDQQSRMITIEGDTVAIAAGFKPNLGLWDELSKISEMEVFAIGDCVEPRTCYDAIHEGFHAAFKLL